MVTGNRDWTDTQLIYDVMDAHLARHLKRFPFDGEAGESREEHAARCLQNFILRHGVNNSGADAIANRWGIERGITIERFPAKWRLPTGGTDYSAGPRRNREMAQAQPLADLCQAFWNGKVRIVRGHQISGTRDAITAAVEAGLPVSIRSPRNTSTSP